jgi:hypothetical protein
VGVGSFRVEFVEGAGGVVADGQVRLQREKPVDVPGGQLDAKAFSGKFPGKRHGYIRTGSEDENVWHKENE